MYQCTGKCTRETVYQCTGKGTGEAVYQCTGNSTRENEKRRIFCYEKRFVLHIKLYQWAGKPTGEKKPRPVMPRPEMLSTDLEQVN